MTTLYYESSDTLAHHGVKGMKWGVRRYQNEDGSLTNAGKKRQAMLDAKDAKNYARADKKVKREAYSKAFNEGTKLRNQFGSRDRATLKVMEETAEASNQADKAYKQAKKDYRRAKNAFKEQKTRDKMEKHGLDYDNFDHVMDVHSYGYKGAQRIQRRMNDKGMSEFKAHAIEIGRQTATGALVAAGGITVASLAVGMADYNKRHTGSVFGGSKKYEVLDAAGKVIRRYN